MRLQKHFARKVGNKEYSKYVVVIPPENVEKLGWEEGEELENKVHGDKLVIVSKSIEKNAKANSDNLKNHSKTGSG